MTDGGALEQRAPGAALRGAGRRARSRTPPCRRCASRCGSSARRRGDPLGPARRPGADRRAPAPLRRGRAGRACSSSSARRRAGARRCARCCGRATTLVVPAVHGRDDASTLAVPCTLRLRGARVASTSTRSRTARCRSSCCSAARCSTPAPDGLLQMARISWEQRGGLPRCRWRCGARRWTRTSPAPRGCGCDKRALRPAVRVQGARDALPSWEDAVDALRCRASGGRRWPTRCARSPTRCSTRATCCGPTAARRSRTSAAGRSAASTRARTASGASRRPVA